MNTRLGPDLRAMIWKEAKENAKWAILALLGIALALVFTIAHQMGGNETNSFRAVWDSAGQVMTFGAPAVGLAFGLLQILPEQRRDQWAFLVHRPASRSTLFWGKALTGMGLTLLATLIPLLGLALWAQAPGHLPAPFDPRLLLGGLAAILSGLAFHAAGLLTALRPARWYGSRALPVAMAVVCALMVAVSTEFGQAVVWVGVFLALLLAAARGSFLTTGRYARQPRAARFSLGVTLFVGLVVVLAAIGILIGSTISTLFPPSYIRQTWTSYEITGSGQILRITSDGSTIKSATDLAGHPVALLKPGSGYVWNDFLHADYLFNDARQGQENYNSPQRYALLIGTDGFLRDGTIWYYVAGRRQVVAYSLRSRRPVGALGPDGFGSGASAQTSLFPDPLLTTAENRYAPTQTRFLLLFPHRLYLFDTDARRVLPLLDAGRDRIGDVAAIGNEYGTAPGFSGPLPKTAYAASVGDHFSLFTSEGRPLFTVSREYDRLTFPSVEILMTPDGRRFFLRYSPRRRQNDHRLLPSLVTEVAANGTVLRRDMLPPLPGPPDAPPPLSASCFGLLSPPVVTAAANAVGYSLRRTDDTFWPLMSGPGAFWPLFCALSLVSGLLSALGAWLIGRRCVFTRGRQWAWAVGAFWLGLPGLLLLLCLSDWPAWEACPNCGRPRVVDRERCEHCGAEFAAPTRDGTEIFEEAEAVASPVRR